MAPKEEEIEEEEQDEEVKRFTTISVNEHYYKNISKLYSFSAYLYPKARIYDYYNIVYDYLYYSVVSK